MEGQKEAVGEKTEFFIQTIHYRIMILAMRHFQNPGESSGSLQRDPSIIGSLLLPVCGICDTHLSLM